jgi:hypothetical protein
MKIRAICCEIIYREACLVAANSPLVVDLEFLPKGLHSQPSEKMRAQVQERIDAVDPQAYSATVLGYALCNNGCAGLSATRTKLVLPKAHDCITFYLGSRERYRKYFDEHPGTYFKTTGWSERDGGAAEGGIRDQLGINRTYEEYVQKYGEDNAKYIFETLGGWKTAYSQMTYVDMGLALDAGYAARAEEEARGNGWKFERIPGDWSLIKGLLEGPWDDSRFLVVEPGGATAASYDDCVLCKALQCGEGRG